MCTVVAKSCETPSTFLHFPNNKNAIVGSSVARTLANVWPAWLSRRRGKYTANIDTNTHGNSHAYIFSTAVVCDDGVSACVLQPAHVTYAPTVYVLVWDFERMCTRPGLWYTDERMSRCGAAAENDPQIGICANVHITTRRTHANKTVYVWYIIREWELYTNQTYTHNTRELAHKTCSYNIHIRTMHIRICTSATAEYKHECAALPSQISKIC